MVRPAEALSSRMMSAIRARCPNSRLIGCHPVTPSRLIGVGRMDERASARKRQQPLSLLDKYFVDRAVRPARMRPTVRDLRDELEELSVALGHAVNRSSRKKSFAQESNRPLDTTFLLRFSNPAKPRLYVHHTGDVEQPRMKANGVAVALENDGLRIVEEPLARSSTKIAACAHQRVAGHGRPGADRADRRTAFSGPQERSDCDSRGVESSS